MSAAASKRGILVRRVEQLRRLPPDKLVEGVLPIGDFSGIVSTMIETAQQILRDAGTDR